MPTLPYRVPKIPAGPNGCLTSSTTATPDHASLRSRWIMIGTPRREPLGFGGEPFCERALIPSFRITCSSINRRHVVVTYGSCITVVPIYRDTAPGRSFNCTLVFDVALPEDAISNLKFSRLIASHLPSPLT
jgi:hypothetical protein